MEKLIDYIIQKMTEAQDIGFTDAEMREQIKKDLLKIVFRK